MNHSEGATGDVLASSAQRILVIGGILAIACGMLFGDIFAIFILHPNNGRIGQALFEAAQLIPVGDVEGIMDRFAAIGGFLENRGTKVDTHSHLIHMGYIGLLLAILQPWIALEARNKLRLAWVFVLMTFLLALSIFTIHYVGLAYSPFSHIGWASILADLSGFVLGVAVLLSLWGLWRHYRQNPPPAPVPTFLRMEEPAARTLLVGGLLLLAFGFLYGAGYAAFSVSGDPASEVDILKNIVRHAADGQASAVEQDFAAFGNWQMYRAINVATHTHINEMGLLLLLLAFVQPFVFYSGRRKSGWARLAVIGAFALPIGILLELRVGKVGSVIADLSGFLVIVALVAMLFGLLRHAGAEDAKTGEAP